MAGVRLAKGQRSSSSTSVQGGASRVPSKDRQIVETYSYCDQAGSVIFQEVRTEPKGFYFRRPDGNGGWINNLSGVRARPVYRLHHISGSSSVAVVEGPKDAETLWRLGIPATTNPGGAGKWTQQHADQLRRAGIKTVLAFRDNDEAGVAHAHEVIRTCLRAGLVVKDVQLPGLPPLRARHGEDVTDWLQERTPEELHQVIESAPNVEIPSDATIARGTRSRLLESISPASGPPASFKLTDLGNAERLAAKFGDEIRYVEGLGWLAWTGQRWSGTGGEFEVLNRAGLTVRAMYAEAATLHEADARERLAKHAHQSEARARLDAMVSLVKAKVWATLDGFDIDPYLLNVQNGTVDLQTGALRRHARADYITKLSPVCYEPGATAPTWNRFLKEIMNGNDGLVRYLQRALGYSLTGLTTEQVLFMLYGSGANGKSTLLRIWGEMLGDYAMQTPTETLMVKREGAIPNDVARLVGARLVTAVEVSEGRRFDEALVKQVTGGDPVSARFLRQEFFQFTPAFKLFLAVNHKPSIRGGDHAIWRRIRLIPFDVRIADAQQDRRLLEKLRAEFPGILAWAVEGCRAWQEEGLGVPAEVRAATDAYRTEEDTITEFIADCCHIGRALEVYSSDLYSAYTVWCTDAGEPCATQKKLGGLLRERGFEDHKRGGKKLWLGLGLRHERGGEHGEDQDSVSGFGSKEHHKDEDAPLGHDHPHRPPRAGAGV